MATWWRGLTLVELLVAITIAGVLLGAAVPAMQEMVAASRLDATVRRLHAHIQLTRTSAVQFRRTTTLCPQGGHMAAAGQRCGSDWAKGYMVFVDADGDAVRDPRRDTLLALEPGSPTVRVTWRAFRRRDTLQFRPDGATHLSNGTFTLCAFATQTGASGHSGDRVPAEHAARVVRLVINVGGRTRTDRTGDASALCD